MRVCKISYFEKRHSQLLYERMRKFSMAVAYGGNHATCSWDKPLSPQWLPNSYGLPSPGNCPVQRTASRWHI